MDKRKFVITDDGIRSRVIDLAMRVPADRTVEVTFGPADKRSLDQNAKLWPMLKDVSEQVCWHGYWLKSDEWKDIFSGSLDAELKVVPNLQGTGFVMLGLRTSKMSKKKFADLIELIYSFGSEKGVKWSERSERTYRSFSEAVDAK